MSSSFTSLILVRLVVAAPLAASLLHGTPVAAQVGEIETALVSVTSDEEGASTSSRDPAISADGRYVVFATLAALESGDTNDTEDVYLRDRATGVTKRVSIRSDGDQVGAPNRGPSISADGRYVVFESTSTLFTTADDNGVSDIYRHDRDPDEDGIFDEVGEVEVEGEKDPVNQQPTTFRVSVGGAGQEGNGPSFNAMISADGHTVVFESEATNLLSGIPSTATDIFVREYDPDGNGIADGNTTTVAASLNSEGKHGEFFERAPAVSGSGRFVVFHSPSVNLDPNDTNGSFYDVFLRDRDPDENGVFDEGGSTTTLVSRNAAGDAGDGSSLNPSISVDGRYIAFESSATNLVPNAPGAPLPKINVYVRDLVADQIRLVSKGFGATTGDGHSRNASISGDGRFVAFDSEADNLVAPAVGGREIYTLDRDLDADGIFDEPGQTAFVRASDGDAPSFAPVISAEGLHTVFLSGADDLVAEDANEAEDVFVFGPAEDVPLTPGIFDLGEGVAGFAGIPRLEAEGNLVYSETDPETVNLDLSEARPGSLALLVIGLSRVDFPKAGGVIVPAPDVLCFLFVQQNKKVLLSSTWPDGIPATTEIIFQYLIEDIEGPFGFSLSNAVMLRVP